MELDGDPWRRRALCLGRPTEFWFPNDAGGVVAAKIVCAACEVKAECLDYALTHRVSHGIYGGTSERERLRILRRRKRRAA